MIIIQISIDKALDRIEFRFESFTRDFPIVDDTAAKTVLYINLNFRIYAFIPTIIQSIAEIMNAITR